MNYNIPDIILTLTLYVEEKKVRLTRIIVGNQGK